MFSFSFSCCNSVGTTIESRLSGVEFPLQQKCSPKIRSFALHKISFPSHLSTASVNLPPNNSSRFPPANTHLASILIRSSIFTTSSQNGELQLPISEGSRASRVPTHAPSSQVKQACIYLVFGHHDIETSLHHHIDNTWSRDGANAGKSWVYDCTWTRMPLLLLDGSPEDVLDDDSNNTNANTPCQAAVLTKLSFQVLAVDLLNPSPAAEAKKHKLKTLVPAPRSFFMDVKCPGCFTITTVFSHAQTVVICQGCTTVLCQPTGGKARLTEGCSFRRK
ncbi:hypothetical protein TruAng_007100 [Truncatella angustata]|nr:hypothetical protein TruAng_007100 [Truncatella angustata]